MIVGNNFTKLIEIFYRLAVTMQILTVQPQMWTMFYDHDMMEGGISTILNHVSGRNVLNRMMEDIETELRFSILLQSFSNHKNVVLQILKESFNSLIPNFRHVFPGLQINLKLVVTKSYLVLFLDGYMMVAIEQLSFVLNSVSGHEIAEQQ